ncbi:hypothetical protein OO012_08815 [Rhodobacteraceae bacterium KMM 6894]|nr:hypothetical protein [Rhodobacteraceae bacterium KMM 6894]
MPFAQNINTSRTYEHELRPGMRLNPLQSAGAQVTEAEIDHVIAQTLAQNRQIEARAALPDIACQDELLGLAGRNARRDAQRETAAATRLTTVQHTANANGANRPVEDLTGRGIRLRLPRLTGTKRKTLRRLVLIVGLGAMVYTWPWVIALMLFLTLAAVLAGLAALGSERIGARMLRVFLWLDARNPARAERLRLRADGLAMRIDALLDRLPDRWTEGLYMPDLSRAALIPQELGDRPDPFDRIAAQARQA